MIDRTDLAFQKARLLGVLAAVVVVAFSLVAFKSAYLALVTVLTIAVTVASIYGLATGADPLWNPSRPPPDPLQTPSRPPPDP
eukprot:4732896-Pyramimonas_sp.AAC.1